MVIQSRQVLQRLKVMFKGSMCSTAGIQNQHKNYTEEHHGVEEETTTAIEEDHNTESGFELKMTMEFNRSITLKCQVDKGSQIL